MKKSRKKDSEKHSEQEKKKPLEKEKGQKFR